MLQHLDATLAAMPAELSLQNVTVSFATPDDQFPPTNVVLPAIVLFLYDVRENYELRTQQWELDRQPGGVATRRRASLSRRLLVPDHCLGQAPRLTLPPTSTDCSARSCVLLQHRTVPETYLRGSWRARSRRCGRGS